MVNPSSLGGKPTSVPTVPSRMTALFSDSDPTGTKNIRRIFKSEALIRLRKVRSATRLAIIETDTLGLKGGHMAYHPQEIRLQAFDMWLKHLLINAFSNHWWDRYITIAWNHGAAKAYQEIGESPQTIPPLVDQSLMRRVEPELESILAVVLQHCSRAAEKAVLDNKIPRVVCSNVMRVFDTVAEKRLMQLCGHFVSAAHNRAKLEVYRQAGHTKVGLTPERIRVRKARDSMTRDDILAGVRTYEDDKVCEECQDFADNAPYDLDEVTTVLPMHLECRCAWYPWDDQRYSHDAK
jgi:hypothetical protein